MKKVGKKIDKTDILTAVRLDVLSGIGVVRLRLYGKNTDALSALLLTGEEKPAYV